ncbi:MAG: ABC transporter substrate-binding protein [Proteiniphilum sp.]|nr:ABC transporter substrate-binding protein [Proteiniphilum sp.]
MKRVKFCDQCFAPLMGMMLLLLGWNNSLAQNGKLIFTPHWIPQAQFAGYYVAVDQGFYKDNGLDVDIVHSTANIASLDLLKNGDADIVSSFMLDAIEQRANGVPLVNIGQLSQHSSLMIVTKRKSGIDTYQKLHTKKLGIWSNGFEDVPLAFMQEHGIKMDLIRILQTVNLFLMDGVDALLVMYYNEYDQINNCGIDEDELNTFFFSDFNLDIPEDGIYCMEESLKSKGSAYAGFLKATLKGWEYASEHREYALDLVIGEMNKAHLPNNRVHQRWMLEKVLAMMEPGKKKVMKGQLLKLDFERAMEVFKMAKGTQGYQTFGYEQFYHPSAKGLK